MPDIPWKVLVADTRTGRVVEPDLPYLDISYDYGINKAGGWSVTLPIDDNTLTKQDIEELSDPWRFCIGVYLGNYIAQMGPLVAERFTDSKGLAKTEIAGSGIWDLFTRKRILAYGALAEVTGASVTQWYSDVVFGPGPNSPKGTPIPAAHLNVSLHTIAKRLIEVSMARPNGALPITLPSDIAGVSEREYPAYDLAYVGERLMQLTQVDSGPEVEFRPQFVDDTKAYARWEMRIGTPTAGGRIGNLDTVHQWEYGNALTHLHFSRDGSDQTHTRFERGGGTERDLLVGYATDPTYGANGWPLLEDAGTEHSSATETATLDSWATAAVNTNKLAVTTWTAVVRVAGDNGMGYDTGSPPLNEFQVGDTAAFQVLGHRRIRDGRYKLRILSVSSGGSSESAVLTTQFLEAI